MDFEIKIIFIEVDKIKETSGCKVMLNVDMK